MTDNHDSPATGTADLGPLNPQPGSRGRATWVLHAAPAVLIAGCVALILSGQLRPEGVGAVALVLMMILMFMKVPVAIALFFPGVLGLWGARGFRTLESAFATIPYESVASWTLSVLPMFILMGVLLSQSGITTKVYDAGRAWLGWMPGGLAVGTNVAGAGLSAVTGSTIGTTYALGRVGIPEMLNAGYDRRMAVGTILTAGLSGQLIPPSIALVIFAGIAEVPVGPQLVAGIVPGVLIAVLCSVAAVIVGLRWPALVGRDVERIPVGWGERRRALTAIWSVPVLILLILGGMYTGVLTATEAGAAGALVALLLLVQAAPRQAGSRLVSACSSTVASVAAIFLIIMGAEVLARMLSVTGLGALFTDTVTSLGLSDFAFLTLLLVMYLILGTFMDSLSMMLLTVPLLLPTIIAMDVSVLWFGVFVVFMTELAIITPPVGILTFIVHRIAQEPEVRQGQTITLGDVFLSVAWLVPVAIVFSLLLIGFPEIVTWLPARMGS